MAGKPTKVGAKIMGKAKAGMKAARGQTGILRQLADEHGQVSTLMKRVARSSETSKLRDELFPQIRSQLLAHAKAEEQVFYPAVRRIPGGEDLIDRSLEQHGQVEEMIEDLSARSKQTKAWQTKFERLMRNVQAHVELEEEEVFPIVRDGLDKEGSNALLERYRAAKEKHLQRLG